MRVTKPVPGTLQEGGAPFQTTHWTVVLQAGQAEPDEPARKALATFSETYWPPLYTFVRRRGYSPADAQDIVQGFFVHLFEHNTLTRADQKKGRLRTFLLGSLQNFLLKQRERMSAIKRGGNQQLVSFAGIPAIQKRWLLLIRSTRAGEIAPSFPLAERRSSNFSDESGRRSWTTG
jgi:DNA-directed RNA polymerase specialized sigma24 family protein